MPQSLGGSFDLTDHHCQRVSNHTFLGRYVLVFFGFTHCKVVCPRALKRISTALDRLGRLADDVQPLYVTVDPERDTPEVMRAFLETHYPRFLGLTGARAEIDAMKKAYRVFAERQADVEAPDGYVVPHTAFTFLLDPDGAYRAHFPDTDDAGALTRRLYAILEQAAP